MQLCWRNFRVVLDMTKNIRRTPFSKQFNRISAGRPRWPPPPAAGILMKTFCTLLPFWILIRSGRSSGSSCDGCGASATYAEVISQESGYSKRTITTSGCPNHYSICTGKPLSAGVCGDIGAEGTASEAFDQNQTIAVPGEPVLARSTTDIECDMGAIAVALNGVAIYAGAVSRQCDLLDVEDDSSEASYAPLQHVPSQPLLGVSVLSSTL
jgi:hypothetical protein